MLFRLVSGLIQYRFHVYSLYPVEVSKQMHLGMNPGETLFYCDGTVFID